MLVDKGRLTSEHNFLLLHKLLQLVTVIQIQFVFVAAALILYLLLELLAIYFECDHEVSGGRDCVLLKVAEAPHRDWHLHTPVKSSQQHIY